ncbi:MAG: tetratricopeptide repeat protein, partial [Planctomycetes bacterium]|nr:tetratricopeptide repeat protein [Planctomycetota bacterium]
MYRTLKNLGWLSGALLLSAATGVRADQASDQFTLAADHYSQQRWDLASTEFEAFLEQFPSHERASRASFYAGESLLQLKKYNDARVLYQRVFSQTPNSQFARQATFRAAEMLFLAGNHEEAKGELEAFDADQGSDTFNAYSLAYRGEIAVDEGEPDTAEALYRDAIRRFPEGPLKSEVRFGLARALEIKGDEEQALRFYRFIAEHSTSSLRDDAHLRVGILLHGQRQYADALKILAKFNDELADSPLAEEARYWTGLSLLDSDNASAAAIVFEQGEGLAKEHPLAAAFEFRRGEACRANGDSEAAKRHFDAVQTTWATSEWADDALFALCSITFTEDDAEQFNRCSKLLRDAHASSPLAAQVAQLTGRLALRQKRYDDAIRTFESLVASDSPIVSNTTHANRYYLGVALLAAERYADALTALTSLKPAEEDAALRDNIAVATASALMALQRYEEAIQPLAEYVTSQPQGPDSTACRAKLTVCYLELDDFDNLETAFKQYQDRDSDDASFLATAAYLAEQSIAKGNVDFGRKLYALLTIDGNPEEYIAKGLAGLGQLQVAEGDNDGSAETFAQLLDKAATSIEAPRAGLMRARSLERTQQFDAAIAAYRLVIENYPTTAESSVAVFESARLHDRLGRDREAHDMLQQLVANEPPVERIDAVLYQLAWVLTDLNKVAESDATFERLAREHSASDYWADSTYRLAERALENGNAAGASLYVKQLFASDLAPRLLAHSLYLVGRIAASEQKWNDVSSTMQRLVDEFPDGELHLPARYWLAEAAFRNTDYDDAGEQFARLNTDLGDLDATWA